jgi:hypothetical protein
MFEKSESIQELHVNITLGRNNNDNFRVRIVKRLTSVNNNY